MTEKTIEQTYQKKTPLEHILLRPDTYVGSIEMEKSQKWVLLQGATKLTYEEINFVPALYKIFDEVLVNAADNYQRDTKMNLLKVVVNQEHGFVSVHNNGKGIPVSIHKDQKVYVPEMIFGHLLTGSNYNDDEKKVVGGRNGYGAKLANIFSTKFIVECGDGQIKKKFRMVWQKNMTVHGQPEISSYSGKDYTIVTFYPDFKRFGMQSFDDDIVALMKKRVYDMAGLMPKVKTFLNESEIEINSFLKYVNMYFGEESEIPKVRDQNVDNDRWQVVVSISDGEFRQVSFVNSICTSKGGTHVNYITEQIVEKIQEKLIKKDKNLNVKPFQIKAHLWVFINCLIQNPAFDSQTKENLTLKQSLFGSKCPLSEKMIKEILKTGIVDQIFQEAKAKELSKLAKITGGAKKAKLTGIPKLEDANDAGTRNSERCTLILTQGDSAKSLAMAGLEVIGRDFYGVFPLKGKLLNAREASNAVLMKNEEIQNIIKIVGLQIGKSYQELKSLRYGSIMIMSDQDTDGSHIKGLVINFIHHFWPSLFRRGGFLKQFITPLLKVTSGRNVVSFYTMRDYKVWSEGIPNLKAWKVKYYKGLGTSTDKEAMEYFENLQRNKIDFMYNGDQDDDAMELIFSKKNADKRKQWLASYDPTVVMVYDRPRVPYKQFVDREFIHFSNQDNNRSIACVIDGFKPGHRKIIFSCFKRNLKEEIKVAQLGGYVAEHSAYHHGQMSLTMTIVNMAQNFVGSNNINLLMPNGQFGSRNLGGKDHASARYIFTNLSKITRCIYPESDDHSLTYIEDDGQLVQPEYYVPIIPMGLVNGCEGIGSGWSTFIPNFNPRELAEMLVRKLKDSQQFVDVKPWYKGFAGEINRKQDGNYDVKGFYEFDEEKPSVIHIKQLPVGKWTKDYKQYLDQIMTEGNDKIEGMREYHTKNKVHFELEMNENFIQNNRNRSDFWDKFFKIGTSFSMKNLVGFNSEKRLYRYASPMDIMKQFYEVRIIYYDKRKAYLMSRIRREMLILSNKERFITEIIQEKLIIRNIKKIKIVQMLKQRGYTRFCDFPAIKSTKITSNSKEDKKADENSDSEEKEVNQKDQSKEYNYLLSLPLWSLTFEKVEEIHRHKKEKENQLKILEGTDPKDIWLNDLNEFLKVLDKVEQEEEEEQKKAEEKAKPNNKMKKAGKVKKTEKEKEKAKQAKKNEKNMPINWDTDSEYGELTKQPASRQNKPKAKKGGKGGQSKKETFASESQPDDLFNRVKRKLESEKNKAELHGNTVVAVPKGPKPTLESYLIKKDSQSDFELKQISKPKQAEGQSKKNKDDSKKKKKMEIDSDESDEAGSWMQSGDDN